MRGYKQLKDLRNRIAVVTGASSGLGEQIAYELARQGAIVVVCARRLKKLEEVSEKCQQLSGRISIPKELDVAQPKKIERLVAQVESELGPIDILVNNAGFGLMEDALSFEMEIAEKMFRVNVLGTMYLSKYVALKMARRQRGAIINVASVAGKIATPKSAVYSATKAAVLGYSNALRLELKALGISVLTVNPGPIKTNFFNLADKSGEYLKKVGFLVLEPDELAQKIVSTVGTNRRELTLPFIFEVAHHFYELFPHVGDYLAGDLFNKK
ncbi:SDR family NAD(P)-dependent oxidoreductase [Liquorilactobacillus satsumensis]|uniref:Short chain dehydrogenase n=1 Tax=Liquorilactobacillus satsumensis DSM 16230 = JCM 12392 TaxID=1423801 RepID=A0A0R1VA46_9LACO|nr:SDR family oxidoreductase [Liquorilactobacillus satsumensis]KRL99861.1 Short chain dehydrogenase [Liquorilactobacillus satsumensis DSM 16230 = JCM 12392]MCC7665649.1 NAD(P)-dependent oxidoreductase [Liquorilactobacillus satsumensis]MCP9311861.1 SDR family oxidoreductase [Liquorilactobacillus satsumensis]MCP9328339.1 SDR family oxidoreductase [Liquorilactobacillus satsumensis]MCP9358034.1 SDR family oxidoreductase [Liquorilactobacillus satsumensis]